MGKSKRTDIKPCPFCGETPEIYLGGDGVRVGCIGEKCDIMPSTEGHEYEDESITDWNRRPE